MSHDEHSDSPINEKYRVDSKKNEPHLFNQENLKDLVRELVSTKEKAEVWGSRQQQQNLLQQGMRISIFCSHHEGISIFSKQENNLFPYWH